MNIRINSFFLTIFITSILFISCDENNPYQVDYSLAKEHKYDLTAADSVEIRESGLKIYYIEAGEGIYEVERRDQVYLFYTGRTWPDNEIFDSSYRNKNRTPTRFDNLGNLVQGFKEGVMGMKNGEKRVLIIPPELGYGNSPGNRLSQDTLRFDIELYQIVF